MSDEIKYKNNPLNGVGLKKLVSDLVEQYGFDILFAYLNINCFKTNASIDSSVKFLKKTEWARVKVEAFYMYDYKSYPRASSEQFKLPPRDRIIPDHQEAGEPSVLSLEDAQRLNEKRAKKAAEFNSSSRSGGKGNYQKRSFGSNSGFNKSNSDRGDSPRSYNQPSASKSSNETLDDDPWAAWRK
ncbi:MAG: VF530 family DNA-binding protein [Oceanospirillaceae bacterium]|nr:VF530 family DNA-binding protein [Oceanospirillaceae bacterium]